MLKEDNLCLIESEKLKSAILEKNSLIEKLAKEGNDIREVIELREHVQLEHQPIPTHGPSVSSEKCPNIRIVVQEIMDHPASKLLRRLKIWRALGGNKDMLLSDEDITDDIVAKTVSFVQDNDLLLRQTCLKEASSLISVLDNLKIIEFQEDKEASISDVRVRVTLQIVNDANDRKGCTSEPDYSFFLSLLETPAEVAAKVR